jgi:D-erythro-7,8-dihydroneopterin triphosphate epimerase
LTSGRLDKIYIRDLAVRCIVGIHPEEREKKQDIIINIAMHADLSKACMSDLVEDTIDYKYITKQVLAAIEPSDYFLIERIAQVVADICLSDKRVEKLRVTIEKPGALRFAKTPAVSIYRKQPRT